MDDHDLAPNYARLAGQRMVTRSRRLGRVTDETWQQWFEAAWAVREEEVYPSLFGPHEPTIAVLTAHLFQNTFKQENVDPRWLHSGVFEVPPNASRASWLYVSSGLSNAWEDKSPDPTGPSGLGMEFVLQTPRREDWAIDRLAHVVAFQILISCGKYPGRAFPITDTKRTSLV